MMSCWVVCLVLMCWVLILVSVFCKVLCSDSVVMLSLLWVLLCCRFRCF